MRTDELDFDLPPELIAQTPATQRGASRLLHYHKSARSIAHRTFSDLRQLLRSGDLVVFNDARVIPARFVLTKLTGGRIDGLFLREIVRGRWHVLLKNISGACANTVLRFPDDPTIHVRLLSQHDDGSYEIAVETSEDAIALLDRLGRMPLPPYIKRDKHHDARDDADRERYQTVYARASGSVAAPTAGLHFTPELLRELDARGVERAFVTLHVGLGTFKPVTAATLDAHIMHTERYAILQSTADALNRAKSDHRRIIPVGTTAARVLESQPADAPFRAIADAETSIFIYPPYTWRHADALITNFHLPRSTLIALVAAMVGVDEQRRIYREAIDERYRFFSYGDAMFVE